MMNNISWQSYWTAITLLSAIYYAVIYLLYFRKRLAAGEGDGSGVSFRDALTNAEAPIPNVENNAATRSPQPDLFGEAQNDFQLPPRENIEHTVYACMDKIAAYLEEVKKSRSAKEELIYALHAILRKYPTISASEYKESLTNVIVNQCEYLCNVHLSADDMVRVWLGW